MNATDLLALLRRVEVLGGGPDWSTIEACCPVGCPWEQTWERAVTIGVIADAVQQHLTEKHAGGEQL